jgi:mono/diheme cytochrome c family protein
MTLNARQLSPLLLLAAAALLAPSTAPARQDVPEEIAALSNPVELEERELRYYERQFKGKCARCHGLDGTGTGAEASAQAVAPANFTDAEYMSTRSDGELFYQILMGGGGDSPMPGFGPDSDQAWSEDKIWHLVAFVRRFAAAQESAED